MNKGEDMMAEINRPRRERAIAWYSSYCMLLDDIYLYTYQVYGYLPLSRLEDEPVSVQGYQEDGEGWEEDAGCLEAAIQLAEQLLKTMKYKLLQ